MKDSGLRIRVERELCAQFLRSLQRAIYKDETSRIISEADAGPLFVIDETVEKIKDGTISNHVYDPQEACLKRAG